MAKSTSTSKATETKKETRKLVRSVDAGVFFGEITKMDGDTVVMKDARNIWYWSGAAGLNELAESGVTRPTECKFTVPVEEIIIFRVCEILSVTPKAAACLDSVPDWRA